MTRAVGDQSQKRSSRQESVTIDQAAHASLALVLWGAGLFVFPLMLFHIAVSVTAFRDKVATSADRY
jgi:cytochrome d ubiquinol oxidase subunit II